MKKTTSGKVRRIRMGNLIAKINHLLNHKGMSIKITNNVFEKKYSLGVYLDLEDTTKPIMVVNQLDKAKCECYLQGYYDSLVFERGMIKNDFDLANQ